MNARKAKRLPTFISITMLLSLFFSYLPHSAYAQIPACSPGFTAKPMVAGGSNHTVALKSDGTVWAWGNNYYGKLGDGTEMNRAAPVQVSGLCDVIAVAAGAAHTVALKNDGTVWTWGNNQYGQLGTGTAQASIVPVQVSALSEVVAVAAGSIHTVALKSNGTVWTWGNNVSGQLGYETDPANGDVGFNPKPLQVSGLTQVKAIAAGFGSDSGGGYGHTVALRTDGTVWTWGSNYYGQLGYDTNMDSFTPNYSPVQVPDVNEVGSIAAGQFHTLALKNDGTVWAWGYNNTGELGDGTTTSGYSPVKVLNNMHSAQDLNGVISIAAAGERSIALLSDGTVWAWGRNDAGQLGDGTTEKQRLFPVKSNLNGLFVAVGSGSRHSIAIKDDGTVWTWGNNFDYELGYDTSTPQNPYNQPSPIPKPVGGFNVTAAPHATLALTGKQRIIYPEWSGAPMTLTALLNNPGTEMTDISLKLIPGEGVSIAGDEAVHVIDKISAGTIATSTWNIKPETEGIHQLTVNAYLRDDPAPFASAVMQIEALAPVVPPAITLGGILAYQKDGTPVAARSSDLVIQAIFDPCTTQAQLTATDANGRKYTGPMNPIPGGAWSHVFNPSKEGLTASPLLIELIARCGDNGPDKMIPVSIILIDPSGIVYNAERGDGKDWPLPGATVTLQYYDPALDKWVEMSEEAYPGKLNPITNPQTTGEEGRYAWDTAAGKYRVIVSRPGFQSAISRIVDVPPPVMDLNVGLIPTDRNAPALAVTGAANGMTYKHSVNIQFTASDDESGIRYVSYRLDQGEVQWASGNTGTITVAAPGTHTIAFSVVDHAGNELAKPITFTIAEVHVGDSHYTVTFNSNGGSPVGSQTVGKGSSAIKPDDPNRDGYSFAGWYRDIELSSAFDFATSIAEDTVLYAKWTTSRNEGGAGIPLITDLTGKSQSNNTARFPILIAGKEFEQIVAASVSKEGERTVYSVAVDAAQLAVQLDTAGNRPAVVFPVKANADKVTLILTGDALKALENRQAVLIIQTPDGNYKQPAEVILTDQLLKSFGKQAKLSNIIVNMNIAKSSSNTAGVLDKSAEKGRFTIVSPPVDFTITASFNDRTLNLDMLRSYAEYEMPLPDGVDPNKITTAVLLETDGTIRPMPTFITSREEKGYAVIHSVTNGAYALIWHPTSFADVEGHWAKLAVNDLAARLIINGVDESRFLPEKSITRAEFAAILIRALGLAGSKKISSFTDVRADAWYGDAAAEAQELGILTGYEDGTFRPTKSISREEAITIIARAMKLAGVDTTSSAADADALLADYSDGGKVSIWARQAVAAAISNGLVSGSGAGLLPGSDITRAETAAIVQKLLKKAKWIGIEPDMN